MPTYFPRPSVETTDEREAQWMEWHGLEPLSSGYVLRPPAGGGERGSDEGGVGEWELVPRGVSAPAAPACPDGLAQG